MDNSIYEVDRDEYVSFLGQLNKKLMDVEEHSLENCTFMKIRSQKTKKHLCTRIIEHETGNEKYFIFNYPDADERIAPKPIMQVTLETKEEVQHFFEALGKLQEKEHGRNI